MIQELAESLNMNERETQEYVDCIKHTLADNFLTKVYAGEMTMPEAITESVKMWDKKLQNMSLQLLSGRVGDTGYGMPKMKVFAEACLDTVYHTLRV